MTTTTQRRSGFAFAVCFIGGIFVFPSVSALEGELQTLTPVPTGIRLGIDGDVQLLANGDALVAGAQGLQLQMGDRVAILATGRFESLDGRLVSLPAGQSGYLVSAIDTARGSVVVIIVDRVDNTVVARREVEFGQSIPDAACLYQNRDSGLVSLFSIDARGMLEQRFVFDPQTLAVISLSVRRDVGVLGAEACAVHDQSAAVFIVDEAMGVRQLSASEESDAIAQPWMLPRPWGVLDGEIEDMAVDQTGAVWALVPDSQRIYRRSVYGDTAYFVLPSDVSDAVAIATDIAIDAVKGRVSIALVVDGGGDLYTAELNLPEGSADAGRDTEQPASVFARSETTPVRRYGDAADDPAVYSGGDAQAPLILGTDKREGLAVYDLQGNRLQLLSVGRLNNVDLVSTVFPGGVQKTIVAASNRDTQSISLFEIKNGEVQVVGEQRTGLNDVYGLCMYASDTGVYVFINDTDGGYEQYRLAWSGESPTAELVRAFVLPSQPEGCVADPMTRRIYMGEEAAGVWMAGAEPDGEAPELIIPTSDALVADVEGMDIYRNAEDALLIVSSQGSDSYAVFDLNNDFRLVAHFAIRPNLQTGVDGVSETDGLAVAVGPFSGYPAGILVVQDGRNRMPDAPQNFKIIDWRDIQKVIESSQP